MVVQFVNRFQSFDKHTREVDDIAADDKGFQAYCFEILCFLGSKVFK